MSHIAGIGVYVPRYRIEASEINSAWARPGGRGRKAVAEFDEDALTMGIQAAHHALTHAGVAGNKLDSISFASVSSGYAEYSLAAQSTQVLGALVSANVADFGLSTRAVTSALQAGLDGVHSKRISHALVIASDKLIAQPGSSFEPNYAAGAGALILAQRGFAKIEGTAAATSGFVGLSRREGAFHGLIDERFVMQHGFLEAAQAAVMRLQDSVKISEWNHAVLQAPDERWASRLLKNLKIAPEKLRSGTAQIGYAGCATFVIHLALAFESAKAGEQILAVSYGPGGCDAVAIKVIERPKFSPSIKDILASGELIKYPHYLRISKLLRGEP
ncbi:hypothetical protein HY229_03475 [Candidatus Acetothermia bacterium]|nr:hypothetical protein [Candidatus Acetothermia bacterium]MBI3643144.1 hypothetical protein [Candidatus Acetothermia bacterium]